MTPLASVRSQDVLRRAVPAGSGKLPHHRTDHAREIINSIAEIKKASAITNYEIGLLDKKVADAIVRACEEIVEGKLHEEFIVDPIQGGAGTSLNMNANEVIANRAIELLGGEEG